MTKTTKALIWLDVLALILIPVMGFWPAGDSEELQGVAAVYPAIAFGILTVLIVIKINFFDIRKKK